MPTEFLARWREAQGADFPDFMDKPVTLGPYYSDQWHRDPKHLLFGLARYKFVAKMLAGCGCVAEVGAGDGFLADLVAREVGSLTLYDMAPLNERIVQHDIMKEACYWQYEAIYALDVFEHIADNHTFFQNMVMSLTKHGKLIIGIPSLESQTYASEPSRKLHVNCQSGEQLRSEALDYFHHVFMFSMNDEVVHTGFMPMAHYLFAVCAESR